LVHGDLRLANLFLDAAENIRLGGFDAAVRPAWSSWLRASLDSAD
jgi:hypothetical protein